MIRRPPRSTRTDTPFPTRRSSDLEFVSAFRKAALGCFARGFIHPPAQEGSPIMRRDGIKRGHNIIEIIRRYAPIAITPAEKSLGKIVHALRSEEHTSELQSLMRISYAVFCLKKKNKIQIHKQKNT